VAKGPRSFSGLHVRFEAIGHSMATRVILFESFEKNICAALDPHFQKSGFETQLETDVDVCLESVRKAPPEVVVMVTNNVTDQGAFRLAEAIRLVHPTCGFVFLSGNDVDGRESYLAAGYEFRVRDIPCPLAELMTATSEAADSPLNTFVVPAKTDSETL
jgi:hypothetical protein